MITTNYAKVQDRPQSLGKAGHSEPADIASLLGTWINTNAATTGISKVIVTHDGSELWLRVFGASETESCDWGEVKVKTLHSDSIESPNAIAFTAEYDFGFLETELQTNVSKGLLIIASLNTFKDGSARSNFFAREYFYKQPGGS